MTSKRSIVIEDKRRHFKTSTFSNYKKTEVIKNLTLALYYGKEEESFFWTGELLCSNMIIELWNVYFSMMSKYIHVYNPKLPLFIEKKFNEFKKIALTNGDDFALRNDDSIRMIFCSITLLLCYSQKYTILDDLNYKFKFNIENLYENLKAPNVTYIEYIYLPNDPKEFIVPFNELIYHLKITKSKIDIHFWINWIIEYDVLCRKKKQILYCQQRDLYIDKQEKLSKNIIWIIWDILIKLGKEQSKHPQLNKIIHTIFNLFTIKYMISYNKKRIHQIYHVIELLLLSDNIDFSIDVLKDRKRLSSLETNIHVTFENIKKNEVQTKEDDQDKKSFKDKKMELYENIYNNL